MAGNASNVSTSVSSDFHDTLEQFASLAIHSTKERVEAQDSKYELDKSLDGPDINLYFSKSLPTMEIDAVLSKLNEAERVEQHLAASNFVESYTAPQINIDFGKYEKISDLGKGGQAVAQLWEKKGERGNVVVLKIFHSESTAQREYDFLSRLRPHNHPNIVSLLGFQERFPSPGESAMALEYCNVGDLIEFAGQHDDFEIPMSEETIWGFMVEIMAGLAFLHCGYMDEGVEIPDWTPILHRDLKPDNILVRDKGKNIVVKIADFGLAAAIKPEHNPDFSGGTFIYQPPELPCITQAADLWAAGAILHFMVHRQPPVDQTVELEGNLDNWERYIKFPRSVVPIHLPPSQRWRLEKLEEGDYDSNSKAIQYTQRLNVIMMRLLSFPETGSKEAPGRLTATHWFKKLTDMYRRAQGLKQYGLSFAEAVDPVVKGSRKKTMVPRSRVGQTIRNDIVTGGFFPEEAPAVTIWEA